MVQLPGRAKARCDQILFRRLRYNGSVEPFSHLSVLLSIILGLAITQVLQGLGRLIQARHRVRFYWPPVLWAVILLAVYVQSWWAMFGLRDHRDWTFLPFSVVVLQTIVLYLLAALVLPDFTPEGPIDLKANYYGHARWFYATAVLVGVVSLGKDLAVSGRLPDRSNIAFHLVFMAASVVAAMTTREWVHKAVSLTLALGFALYVAFLFSRLG